MLRRILRTTSDQIQALKRSGSTYHRANNTESTELDTLTTASNNAINMSCAFPTKSLDVKTTSNATSIKPKSVRQHKPHWSGWKFGATNFAICATVVFLINLIITIWASIAHRETEGVLSEGDCTRIKRKNSGLHILINVLSTILLSGSNYCMQCLSAPTRGEINKAHGARRWLDIGVPSFRNLRFISRRRLFLWLLLAISSLPLHLLYNSAIYASITTNSYKGFMVSQAFVDDPTCQNCTNAFHGEIATESTNVLLEGLWAKIQNETLDRLNPAECIDAYGTAVQSHRRNLFVVTANENVNPELSDPTFPETNWTSNKNILAAWTSDADMGLKHYEQQSDPTLFWLCSGLPEAKPQKPCLDRLAELRGSSQPWAIDAGCSDGPGGFCDRYRWPVDYCLSERAEPRCRLHFSLAIAIVVTVLNFVKALLMFYTVYSLKDNPLMTMGDAVASFLDDRDVTTGYLGFLGIRNAKRGYSVGPMTWDNRRPRWKHATSRLRRIVTLVLLAIAVVTVIALLIWGVREMNQIMSMTTSNAFRLGFGAIDPRTLISSGSMPTDMVSLALIANLPQVILSFLYFAYNSLFTAMLMGYEWMSYAHKRKGLRISRIPTGHQRSTYFLQLPYRFGVPLVILSGTLHWLVSQSIFVVAFDLYDEYGEPITDYIGWDWDVVTQTVGYSPIAMLAVVVLGVVMVVAVTGFGYIPHRSGMPLAGSCSLAISAACHPEERSGADDGLLSEQKLQWGVVSISVDGIGHCAFSSREVGPLVKGQMYA